MTEHVDVVVVGLGVGGEAISTELAEAGLEVVGIEAKLVGGECPYWGCIPSKIMVEAARTLAEARRVNQVAGEATVEPDWAPVAERIREATDDWDDQVAVERLERAGVRVVKGLGRLVGPSTVDVAGSRFEARRGVVLAVGAKPVIPPIEGLGDVGFWTNREAIETKTLPESMVVIGAGAVGLEIGQTFARFGVTVTMADFAERPLPQEEPEAGEAVLEALTEEGIDFRLGKTVTSVQRDAGGVAVLLDDGTSLTAERLLVGTGRRPNLEGLGLETLGLDPRQVEVDGHLAVRGADGLWLIGDANGLYPFTPVSMYHARIVAARLRGEEVPPADHSKLPRVTFTDPEVGAVGLSEAEARERGHDVAVVVKPVAETARGWIAGGAPGVIKLVADRREGVLLGGTSVGPRGGDVLAGITMGVDRRVPIGEWREMVFGYPTYERGVRDALLELEL